ncbi:MAG: RNA polymerase sigma factor [Chromatiales bacterium]|nr:RNA polymerase sigma factor [Chromatiales bacterium]
MVAVLPRLRRFAYALTGSMADGDDVVQTVCERALTRMHQYEPGTRLDSWLFRIAKNVWIDEWRRRRSAGPHQTIDDGPELAGGDLARESENRLEVESVSAAMDRLPEDQRLVLVAVCVDGMSYKEAAELLEIPIGTVMSRLARARRRLMQELGHTEDMQ